MEFRLLRHGVVDSTNERALEAVRLGSARHGDVHLAEGQTAGRGRRGRTWSSPAGEGLYLSIVLLPRTPPRPAALTMGAGLAVLEAARALGARGAELKWPNDVCVEGAKLAGILVEARGLDPAKPHAVVGIGLNVLQSRFEAALREERAVTSLALLGYDGTRSEAEDTLLARLAQRLAEACEQPERTARDYAQALGLDGREVRVESGRGTARGRLVELTLDGLRLEGSAPIALEHVLALQAHEDPAR